MYTHIHTQVHAHTHIHMHVPTYMCTHIHAHRTPPQHTPLALHVEKPLAMCFQPGKKLKADGSLGQQR